MSKLNYLEVDVEEELSLFDKQVFDAIVDLYTDGRSRFTLKDIYQAMGGTTKFAECEKMLKESFVKLTTTEVIIVRDGIEYKGGVLSGEMWTVKGKGVSVTEITIFKIRGLTDIK